MPARSHIADWLATPAGRREWLRSVGRDPFNELVIPATGIKLLQWTGRAAVRAALAIALS